ncbi:MAG: dihydrolipoamide acetyltransferase family protein [Solirubrobacteraceae bacterium]
MLTAVVMPQLGLEVTEGVVVEILVTVGARVEKDDPLVVLSTDKADTDVVAPVAGVVREVGVAVGETVAVGATLLHLGDDAAEPSGSAAEHRLAEPPSSVEPPGSAAEHRLAEPSSSVEPPRAAAAPRPAEPPRERRVAVDARSASMDGQTSPRLRAAPVARRAAADLGIALESLAPGSGPNGRITLRDVRRAAGEGAGGQDAAPAPALEPLSPLKRAVARRMAASQREIPQFQLVREVDATHLLAQKDAAAAAAVAGGGARPGVNDLLVQAIGEMVVRHPDLGAVFVAGDGDTPALQRPDSIDVGLAVATDRGLLVPVIRRATERTLREIAAERVRLVAAAREGRIDLAELSGGTISLSNLGSFGIDRFTAMVNPGESAIVAVGRTVERLVPRGRGIAVVPILTVTLSLDHRVVDGATGAGALAELAALLEGEMPWRV